MAELPETLAFRVWVRIWSQGRHDSTNAVLDNARLFPQQPLIDAVNAAIPKGGKYDDTIEALRENGQDDVADELEEIAVSTGSSDPQMFRRYFEKVRRPYVAEELAKVAESLKNNGTSSTMAHARVSQLFKYEREIRESAPEDDSEGHFLYGDLEMEPETIKDEFIVEDMIVSGTTVASGPAKESHKSTFFIGVVFHIQNGMPFLGKRVRQLRCGMVQRDMSLGNFLEYTRAIQQGMGIPQNAIPGINRNLDLSQTKSQEWLAGFVERESIKFLVIDTLRAVSCADENSAKEIKPVIRTFINGELRDRLGCSVVLIAHPSRSGLSIVAGSADWEGAADSILKFSPRKRGDEVESVSVFGRGRHEDLKFGFAVDHLEKHGGGCVVRLVEYRGRGRPIDEGVTDAVLDTLAAASDPLSRHQIGAKVGKHHKTIQRALDELRDTGQVEFEDNPTAQGKLWSLRPE